MGDEYMKRVIDGYPSDRLRSSGYAYEREDGVLVVPIGCLSLNLRIM
ncbi:MAG: hypothetical protein FWH47_07515 [Methanomassiliicoccaceae archaeon]|nr:hypothetical protein [Methanomassiliicoccaceae archaeon]